MKLLFDQNLSFKLCQTVVDLFPESNHVRHLGLSEVGDGEVAAHRLLCMGLFSIFLLSGHASLGPDLNSSCFID